MAAAVVAAALASPASAKTCAQKVIDDWVDNANVDGTYEIHCYREAIAALPEDAATYSSASDDIRRALQERLRQQAGGSPGDDSTIPPLGEDGSTTPGVPGEDPEAGTDGTPPAGEDSEDGAGGLGAGGSDGGPSAGDGSVAAPSDAAFGADLGDGGSSLPLPVIIVIAALGVAAAAAAGAILIRRLPRSGEGPPNAPSGTARG